MSSNRQERQNSRTRLVLIVMIGVVIASSLYAWVRGGRVPFLGSQTSPVVAPTLGAPKTTIDNGFLLYESFASPGAAGGSGQEWTVGDATVAWPLAMCVGNPQTIDALQARRAQSQSSTSRMSEQVTVFADATLAAQGMVLARSEAQRCVTFADAGVTLTRTVEPVNIGDEAFVVKTDITYAAGAAGGPKDQTDWDVFARRGDAIVWYSSADRAQVERDATIMVGRMCKYAGEC